MTNIADIAIENGHGEVREFSIVFPWKIRERRPEHRTRNGTGTERERTGTRTREMLVQHLRHSRLPSAFLAAGKNADGNARGRTICILSRPQNANEIFVKTVT